MDDTLKCKTCDELGCPVEGMTCQCPICGEIYCAGHVNNHEHKMAEVRFTELRVWGIGRVGSYAKAKQGGYSRSHKYWAICYFDKREQTNTYSYGNRECSDSPHFKTKTAAEQYLNNI